MKKTRNVVVNGVDIEMLDVRSNGRFGDLEHLEQLCNNLSTEANYKELWDYVVVKPKWDEILPEDHNVRDLRATFQNTMLPVFLPVIGYSQVPVFKAVEELQQFVDEGLLGSSCISINFMSGSSISRFLHLVRFIGRRYPELAQGLSSLKRKEWREIKESARKDGFQFKDTDYREYTHGKRQYKLLLPVWIRHRLAHPENEDEKKFPTENDYRRAFAILAAAIAGKAYSDSDDNEHSHEEPNHD